MSTCSCSPKVFGVLTWLKNATFAYIAFGLGMIIGSIIASIMASFLMIATLDESQLERLNEIAEDLKEE